MPRHRVLIIGGGIGGLSAGIALRRAGFEVDVFERAPEFTEIGAGISLWANAIYALQRLGLADTVTAASEPYEVAGLRAWNGEVLAAMSAADLARQLGTATIIMHRADLLSLLRSALGTSHLHLAKTLVAMDHQPDGVTAKFSDGTGATGDVLVGADGLHSVVRTSLHDSQPPRYAGCTAWRAVVPFIDVGVRASESWGYGRVFGQVPMSGGRVYWYATENTPEGGRHADEKSHVERLFRGWHSPIEALISATPASSILRNDIYDRPPLKRWGSGRITLLGDAAHPMTPFLGQGGCQALEDAVVLADCLRERSSVPEALRNYEARRASRTRMFVRRSRQACRIAQLENPVAVRLRNVIFRMLPSNFHSRPLVAIVRHRV